MQLFVFLLRSFFIVLFFPGESLCQSRCFRSFISFPLPTSRFRSIRFKLSFLNDCLSVWNENWARFIARFFIIRILEVFLWCYRFSFCLFFLFRFGYFCMWCLSDYQYLSIVLWFFSCVFRWVFLLFLVYV